MKETFVATLWQMVSIFSFLGIGLYLNRMHILGKETKAAMSKLCTNLFLPCLSIYSGMTEFTRDRFADNMQYVLYGLVFTGVSVLISIGLTKLLARRNPERKGVFHYALAFPNAGSVGTPIVLAFFGMSGYLKFSLLQFGNLIMTYSWGIRELVPVDHGKRRVLGKILGFFTPPLVATLLGLAIGLTGFTQYLPEAVPGIFQKLGNCYLGMVLILTGAVIGDYRLKDLLGGAAEYTLIFLRLLALPCIYLLVLKLLHAPQFLCCLAMLIYACPCGMNVVVYPAAFGLDAKPGAKLVLVSTTLALLTVPLVYALSFL